MTQIKLGKKTAEGDGGDRGRDDSRAGLRDSAGQAVGGCVETASAQAMPPGPRPLETPLHASVQFLESSLSRCSRGLTFGGEAMHSRLRHFRCCQADHLLPHPPSTVGTQHVVHRCRHAGACTRPHVHNSAHTAQKAGRGASAVPPGLRSLTWAHGAGSLLKAWPSQRLRWPGAGLVPRALLPAAATAVRAGATSLPSWTSPTPFTLEY